MYKAIPLCEEHLQDAARLVSTRYQRLLEQAPDLPPRYSDVNNLVRLLQNILKPGTPGSETDNMQNADSIHPLTFSNTPTEREIDLIRQRMGECNRKQTNGEYDKPGIEVNLVLKNVHGNVVGGISASTQLRVMYLEALCVADEYPFVPIPRILSPDGVYRIRDI